MRVTNYNEDDWAGGLAAGVERFFSAASVFDTLAVGASRPALREHLTQHYEVLAAPGAVLAEQLRPGDLLIRRGEAGLTHVAVVAAPGLWHFEHLSSAGLRPESSRTGLYAHVVEGGAFPHTSADNFARLVADLGGRVPHNQLLLRPRQHDYTQHFLEAAIPPTPTGQVMPTPPQTRHDEIKAPPGFTVVDEKGEPLSDGEYNFYQGGVIEHGNFQQRRGRALLGKIDPTRPFVFEVLDRVCAIRLGAFLNPDDPAIEYGGTWFDWTLVRDDKQPDANFWPHYQREMDTVFQTEEQGMGSGRRVDRFLQHEHITRRPLQIAKPFLTQLSRLSIRASAPRIRVGPFVRYSDHERAAIWLETLTPCMVRVRYKRSSSGTESSRYATTVRVGGRHFALVEIDGLQEDIFHDYTVELAPLPASGDIPITQADLQKAFPKLTKAVCASLKEQLAPASLNENEWLTFRTLRREYKEHLRFATGSCRWYPGDRQIDRSNNQPFCDVKPNRTELKPRKRGVPLGSKNWGPDMLRGLGDWLMEHSKARDLWPHFLFFCGDQIYSDEMGIDHGSMLAVGRFASRVPGPTDPAPSLRERLIDGAWAGRFAHRYKPYTEPDAKTVERISDGIEKLDAIHYCNKSIKGVSKVAPLVDRKKALKKNYDTVDTKWSLSKTHTEPPDVRAAREALELLPTVDTLETSSEPFRAHLYHWQAGSHFTLKRNPMSRRFLSHNFVLWQIPDFEQHLPVVDDKHGALVAKTPDGRGHPSVEGGRHAADFAEYAYLYERAWMTSRGVRVLLAQVPTFLMFDDHEVTDDWNFDASWVRMLHNRKDDFLMWPKTLTDALAAYWVYQGWGNKAPSKWKADDPRVKALDDARRSGVDALPELRRCIFRGCYSQVPSDDPKATFQTGLSLEWHYRLPFDPPFLVPDCRSRKKLAASDEALRVIDHGSKLKGPQSQTIDDKQLDWMRDILLAWRGGPVAFVGFSTPFLMQKKVMTLMLRPETVASAWAQGMDLASLGAAILDSTKLGIASDALLRVFRKGKDIEHMIRDRSWSDVWGLVGQLKEKGSPLKSLVLVSGDVHHSYNMTANLPGNGRPKPELVQITSSGLQTTIRADTTTAMGEEFSALPFELGKYQLVPGFMVQNNVNEADVALYENSVALVDVAMGGEVNLTATHIAVKKGSQDKPAFTEKDFDRYVFKYTSGPAYMEGSVPTVLARYWRERKMGPRRGEALEGWGESWAEYEPPTGIIPPVTPNPKPPAGLVLLPHAHETRSCEDGKKFKTGVVSSSMTPSAMNPGFLRADGEIDVDPSMQGKLLKLLKDVPKFAVMMPDKIQVALVDLTGDKICKPLYAGYRSTASIYSASTLKYGVLYAAHQLIFDLNELARVHHIKTFAKLEEEAKKVWSGLKCRPDLDWLAQIDGSTGRVSASEGKPGAPEKNLRVRLAEMIKAPGLDMAASELILRIGFEYIASVLWSTGLFHPQRTGLWIGNTFAAAPPPPTPNTACHTGTRPTYWAGNPYQNPFRYNSNSALSMVTFLTLLAQRRLVSEADSQEMERLLNGACYLSTPPANTRVRATKCGLLKTQFRHELGLMEGTDSNRLYAFAVMTVDQQFPPPPGSPKEIKSVPWPGLGDFVAELDKIIRGNNP